MEKIVTVSIVIPIFNVAPYLPQCLDSVYTQIDNSIEVILVNDGSTDNSKQICERYYNQYPNTVLVNKNNGGLSDARNAGTTVARGEFIYYLDSDDWLAPNAIKALYDFAVENHCEVVQGGFYYAYENHLLFDNSHNQSKILDKKEAMLELIKNEYVKNFAWGKLYRADIIKKYSFPFGKYFEDSYWQHHIINETNNYGIVPKPLYYYRQRSTGISGSFSKKSLDLIEGNVERLNFIRREMPNYTDEMAKKLWKIGFSLVQMAQKQKDKEIKQVYQRYWEALNIEYHDLFDRALVGDKQYCIAMSFPQLMPLYVIVKKIANKMHPTTNYQIIKTKQ